MDIGFWQLFLAVLGALAICIAWVTVSAVGAFLVSTVADRLPNYVSIPLVLVLASLDITVLVWVFVTLY